ncbi:MAG TPA: acyl-CoA dehydrogenase, partial [Gemmatimonadetes bacterium]|nr:acyl-CoA dehydrogenase [Gemmatimonadota bacterium]
DERLLGQHGASINAMSIDNVKVPVENVLGEVGKGHKVAFCTLNVGRLKLATNSASGARKAVEVAAQYAAERIQFGRPIGDFGL